MSVVKPFFIALFLSLSWVYSAFADDALKIVMPIGWPPYSDHSLPNGGALTHLIHSIFSHKNQNVNIYFAQRHEAISLLKAGEIDAIGGVFDGAKATNSLPLSSAFYTIRLNYVTLEDNALPDLSTGIMPTGETTIVGYSGLERFAEILDPEQFILQKMPLNALAHKFFRNRIHMAVALPDRLHAMALNLGYNPNRIKIHPPTLYENTLHLAFRPNDVKSAEIKRVFDLGLKELRKNGRYYAILAQHHLQ